MQVTLTDTDGRSTVELDLDSSPPGQNSTTPKTQQQQSFSNSISRAKSARPKTSIRRSPAVTTAANQLSQAVRNKKPVQAKTILRRRSSAGVPATLYRQETSSADINNSSRRRKSLGSLVQRHLNGDDASAIFNASTQRSRAIFNPFRTLSITGCGDRPIDTAKTGLVAGGMKGGRPPAAGVAAAGGIPVRRTVLKDVSPERPSWGFGQPVSSRAPSRAAVEDYGALYERVSMGPSRAPSRAALLDPRAALAGGLSYEDIIHDSSNSLKYVY